MAEKQPFAQMRQSVENWTKGLQTKGDIVNWRLGFFTPYRRLAPCCLLSVHTG